MAMEDQICTDNPMDGHDKFCPIWIVGDRIMTECECELINKVQQRVMQDAKEWEANAYIIGLKVGTNKALDAAEEAIADIRIDFPFDIRDVPTYGKKVLAAIRGLREGQ